MATSTLRDIVIVLPGITGSVLQVHGKDVWGPSPQAIWPALTSFSKSLEQLVIKKEDDPKADDLGDGVCATELMPRVVVPGLIKIDGYTRILDVIQNSFSAIRGTLQGNEPANFFAFPYDWRRDNRVAARKLKALIDSRLPLWREFYPEAKVILIGHSMGGLVARYYLEVLEGWRECKALITFGTPFRGSLDTLNYVANGYKEMFLDLTSMLRSYKSVYQCMPIYEAVQVDGVFRRVAEIEGIPHQDVTKARDALAFHREIEAAVARHQKDADYIQNFKTIPFVGTMQPTLQSAILSGPQLTLSRSLPDIVDQGLEGGDGTVPRVSAIPIELSEAYRETFYPERHSALPANEGMLNDLARRLEQMQAKGTMNVRGPEKNAAREGQPAIGIDLDDAYLAGEPVVIHAVLHNVSGDASLDAQIRRIDGASSSPQTTIFHFSPDGAEWKLALEGLPAGQYRATVDGRTAAGTLDAVHEIFDVMDPSVAS